VAPPLSIFGRCIFGMGLSSPSLPSVDPGGGRHVDNRIKSGHDGVGAPKLFVNDQPGRDPLDGRPVALDQQPGDRQNRLDALEAIEAIEADPAQDAVRLFEIVAIIGSHKLLVPEQVLARERTGHARDREREQIGAVVGIGHLAMHQSFEQVVSLIER
jgi:hypothetical protein